MTIQQKIKHFFDVVNSLVQAENSRKELAENGLVVIENDSSTTVTDVFNNLPEGRGRFITLSDPSSADDFVRAFSIANREGQYLFVDLQCDPHPNVISVLKQVADDNEATVSDYKDKELYPIKLNPQTRIIFCCKRELIENQITYPHFYDLFGPVLSL